MSFVAVVSLGTSNRLNVVTFNGDLYGGFITRADINLWVQITSEHPLEERTNYTILLQKITFHPSNYQDFHHYVKLQSRESKIISSNY